MKGGAAGSKDRPEGYKQSSQTVDRFAAGTLPSRPPTIQDPISEMARAGRLLPLLAS